MKIPKHIESILSELEKAGYQAYLVGGCVRDILMRELGLSGVEGPKDWDITTNAKPEEIQKVFPDSVYENDFGTVGVKIRHSEEETEVVEVTPFRKEEAYSDKRHPDKVVFTQKVEDDLARRDFTINAIAMGLKHEARNPKHETISKSQNSNSKNVLGLEHSNLKFVSNFDIRISDFILVDPFGGQKDIEAKLIRAVGNPEDRFNEDALRLMRAVRFAAQLGFDIESNTKSAIESLANNLKAISHERIRDELTKLIASNDPEKGIILMQELGLLKIVLPEVEEGVGVAQNKHHIYNVFEHLVKSLGFAAKYNYNIYVRFASLLHDIGKPRTKEGTGEDASFYGHEFVGAKMTAQALERLKFSKDFIEKVYTLVRYHMFYYNVDEVTEKSVRRLVRKVGPENMEELLELRQSERKGSGVPKAEPYRLRHLKYMIDKVSRDPLTVGMLKVNGNDVMDTLGVAPGPKIGHILNALLEEVIDDPARNEKESLVNRMKELNNLSSEELIKLAQAGKDKLEEEKEKEDEGIKGKYYVR